VTLAPAGPFGLGITPVTLTVTDDKGASASCSSVVVVVDTTPPLLSQPVAAPSLLWPPNHKLVSVAIDYSATDNCSAPAAITCALGVASNEPVDGVGDGDTSPDWLVTGAHGTRLRAERAGNVQRTAVCHYTAGLVCRTRRLCRS
jgi:hypothetical protein